MQQPNETSDAAAFDVEAEYRAIEAALLNSPRGRWFLAEHGRRARRLDSAALDDAVQRLNSCLRQPPALLGALKREIEALQTVLSQSRQALLAKVTPTPGDTDGPPTPQAILRAAEDLHERVWSLQADEVDPDRCQSIAREAARIYALSQMQAAEGARTRQYSEALEAAGARLAAILDIIAHELQSDSDPTTAVA